jgi:hypothetical protein
VVRLEIIPSTVMSNAVYAHRYEQIGTLKSKLQRMGFIVECDSDVSPLLIRTGVRVHTDLPKYATNLAKTWCGRLSRVRNDVIVLDQNDLCS